MDNQKRLLVALGLSFLATLLYTQFVLKPQAERELAMRADAGVPEVAAADAGVAAVAQLPMDAGVPATAELPPIREVTEKLEKVHYTFTSAGGGLTKAELQGPKMREQQQVSFLQAIKRMFGGAVEPAPQVDMAQPVPGQPLPLSVSIVGAQPLPAGTHYRMEELDDAVAFATTAGTWRVEKRVAWRPDSHQLRYDVQVTNVGPAPAGGELGVHLARAIDPECEQKPSFLLGAMGNLTGADCRVGVDGEPELIHALPDTKEPRRETKGPIHFIGIDQQYFLAALYPLEGAVEGRCVVNATPSARTAEVFFPLTLSPGETRTFRFGVYIGPKDDALLAAAPADWVRAGVAGAFDPELEETIQLGWWAVVAKLLLPVMKFFHGIFGNWGVAIIFLTLVVKIALLPLTHKMMVSGEQMKKLQPKIEEIRKKWPDDKERQNLETMKLFQQEKVYPWGGCLLLLPQLPIWGGLFAALRTSYDLYNEPFIAPLWTDLTYKDPAYLLPVALGVTMIITQRMQPQMLEKSQAVMMTWVMPIFFTLIMLQYPAGLSLYIFTNNILSIIQQQLLRRWLEHKGIAAPRKKPEPARKVEAEKKPEKKKMREKEA